MVKKYGNRPNDEDTTAVIRDWINA